MHVCRYRYVHIVTPGWVNSRRGASTGGPPSPTAAVQVVYACGATGEEIWEGKVVTGDLVGTSS